MLKKALIVCFVCFSHLSAIAQPDPAAIFKQGLKEYKDKNYTQAVALFEQASNLYFRKDDLSFVHCLYRIAYSSDQMGKYEDSNRYYDSAIQFVKNNHVADTARFVEISSLFGIGNYWYYKNEHELSAKYYENLYPLTSDNPSKSKFKYKILAYMDQFMARNMMYTDRLDSAYYYVQRAEGSGLLAKLPYILGESYSVNAEYYFTIGNLAECRKFILKQYNLYKKEYGETSQKIMRPTSHLGLIAYQLGDYAESEKYMNKVYLDYVTRGDTSAIYFSDILANMGDIYYRIGKKENSLKMMTRCINLLERIHESYEELHEYYGVKASIAAELGQVEVAQAAIAKAERILNNQNTKEYYKQLVNAQLIEAYHWLGDNDKSEQMALALLDYRKKNFGVVSYESSRTYLQLAEIYLSKNNMSLSKVYVDSAFYANNKNHAPHQIDIYQFVTKLPIEVYGKEQMISKIQEGVVFIDELRKTVKGENSKAVLAKNFYTNAISIFAKQHDNGQYANMIFTLFEKNKSLQLIDFIKEAELLNTIKISDQLLATKSKITNEMAILDQKIETSKEEKNEKLTLKLQTELVALTERFDEFRTQLKQQYPAYYQIKYDEGSSLKDLQKVLAKQHQNLISFHLNEDQLFILLVTETNLYLHEVSKPETAIMEQIEGFRNALYARNDINSTGKALYNLLLAPIADEINQKKLVIIPDEALALVPFEILVDNKNKYLIEDYSVAYDYSATTYLRSHKTKSLFEGENLLAMAPEFKTTKMPDQMVFRNELTALPGANEEAILVSKLFGGISILGDKATESHFKSMANQYKVLHLATHAIVDNDNSNNSRLVFSNVKDSLDDGFMYPYEIYTLNLKADLVTLSACNTGFGNLKKGEGVVSLSRAFAYAGCTSTIMSLWPVSDKTTPEIMSSFYMYLEDGLEKDEAIRKAKLDYLLSAKNEARHPYFWAGFILNGDTQPIVKTTPWYYYLMASGVILLLLVVAGSYYKSSRSKVASS